MPISRQTSFLDRIARAPIAYDARAVAIARERWAAARARLVSDGAHATAAWENARGARQLLDGVFGNSPFLTRLILLDPEWTAGIFAASPEARFDGLIEALGAEVAGAEDPAAAMKTLRRARARAALLIALGDLGGVFELGEVTSALSRLADAVLEAALRFLLRNAAQKGQFLPRDASRPEKSSGLIILAMGKYGAFELNYSSDIDLIAFYDPDILPLGAGVEPAPFTVRLVRDLVQLLQARTEDGYVFRVDLRLRPDGNAAPVAISINSAELYYESAGQNWERAAMIKARACAGDVPAGEAFLASLKPYVWRKNLDYAAIEDIHSIKRQIHSVKGHGEIAVAGHNLKLGRGGIREIEFFAQTQQLILGGRMPELRLRGTCEALAALAGKHLIEDVTCDEMKESYGFLRTIEHRLQMVDDEQTHTLPKTQSGLDQIARFADFTETADFEAAVRAHLTRVQRHYSRLFESEAPLAVEKGSLVFTGVEEDPETLETLKRQGFKNAREVSARIRGWHHGRIRATRSARSRERLTRLVPMLLDALAATPNPDSAFTEFSRFVEALPVGVQLFALLVSNPWLLSLLSEIFSLAPRLSRVLAERPAILDTLIDPDFLKALTEETAIDEALAAAMVSAGALEDALDEVRIFARERQFRIAVRVLKGAIDPAAAGRGFTAIAESTVRALAAVAEVEIARRHGRIAGGEWVVLALGKLGGREMTASSDLDLIFVYDFDGAQATSTGPQPLHATQYFTKLGQRLISLLTVPTREGRLYDVDMRLRPSGRAGPVAVTLERLRAYHETQAWTYEQMALSRSRMIWGAPGLGDRVAQTIQGLLAAPRDPAKLAADALDMRARLEAAKPAKDLWALKLVRGGLVDLEYIAQTLLLAFADKHPNILSPATADIFARLIALDILPAADMKDLFVATELLQGLTQVLRIAHDRDVGPDPAAPGLKARLAQIGGVKDFAVLEFKIGATQARVRQLFEIYVRHLPARFAT
jgi:glutamate-ammonia-ligase adenylyltransferase